MGAGVIMQVTLDTVEVVLALKDDGSGQHGHGEGLKETVQQAAAGLVLTCVHNFCIVLLVILTFCTLRAAVM